MLVRYRPQRPRGVTRLFSDYFNIIDSEAEDLFGEFIEHFNNLWNPNPLDVREDDEYYLITIDVPGFKKDEIKVNIEQGKIRIHGETAKEGGDNKDQILQKKKVRAIDRTISVPENLDIEASTADLIDGVLVIHLRKVQKVESTHTIEIK